MLRQRATEPRFGPRITAANPHSPSIRCPAEPQRREARVVHGRGQKFEVRRHLRETSNPCSPASMFAPRHMGDLSLDLRTGGPIVRAPLLVSLSAAGPSKNRFVAVDGHRTTVNPCLCISGTRYQGAATYRRHFEAASTEPGRLTLKDGRRKTAFRRVKRWIAVR
jgi:hypothetical protein